MPARLRLLVAAALAACHPAAAPGAPAPSTAARAPVVVLISAGAEWKAVVAQLAGAGHADTPYGPWFPHRIGDTDVVFFHGGFGKVSAAGSTQYAIDRWHPTLLVNLGTCGGFAADRKPGDIVLASETYIYDIYELMGDAAESIEYFHSTLDPTLWPARLASRVHVGPIVSADRDVDPAAPRELRAKYHATVGDWESAAIAFVATRNRTPLVVLRGVSDLVDAAGGDPTYQNEAAWQRLAATTMAAVVGLFTDALPELLGAARARPAAARPAR